MMRTETEIKEMFDLFDKFVREGEAEDDTFIWTHEMEHAVRIALGWVLGQDTNLREWIERMMIRQSPGNW